ncbi:MAG: protein kinase [bacterium]|nr:protein kinase [bacterium]
MSDSRDNGPKLGQSARLERLAEAMEVFLRHGDGAVPDQAALLAQHPHLREELEPMFESGFGAPAAEDDEIEDSGVGHSMTPGQCFGDYRIVREVGRGGMGAVFEAEQISLGRRVALKLLHDRLTWSPAAIARFRREAAVASSLQHPGIVPIYEVGEWEGRHYFSMEFLAGRPLHEVMHQPRLGVRSDCSRTAEAAELVARVADALQHAHERGLVHRDVKPHNIMLGLDGSVRLLDFGLVKELQLEQESVTREYLGTPHYSSPEQVAGKPARPTSDVFSLGIVLYELLSGRLPFDGPTSHEVLNRIEVGEFEPLSRAARGTPRDLQIICGKAMEQLPGNRYSTAGELAADLRRFLRIEPIQAKPPRVTVRVGKWLRRHRLQVALWGVVSLLIVAAPLAYAVHEHRTRLAVERERKALDHVERLAFRGIEQSLTMLAEDLARQPGMAAERQDRVDRVMAMCEEFLAIRAFDPERALRTAAAYRLIGYINIELGNPLGAQAACRRGRELVAAGSSHPDTALFDKVHGQLLRLELLISQHINPTSAADEFARVIAHWRTAAERSDAAAEFVLDYAETLIARARALAELYERRGEAESLLRQALVALEPERPGRSDRVATAMVRATNGLAHLVLWDGRPADALVLLERVLESIAILPPNDVLAIEQTFATAAVGEARRALGQRERAEATLRRAITVGEALAATYPGSRRLQRAILGGRVRLAGLLLTQRDFGEAEQLLRAAVPRGERWERPLSELTWMDRSLRADACIQLANSILIQRKRTDWEEARALLMQGVELLDDLVREQPRRLLFRRSLGGALSNLAALANEESNHVAARGFAERAVTCQQAVLAIVPEDSRAIAFLAIHHSQLALALARLDQPAGAIASVKAVMQHSGQHVPSLRHAAEAGAIAARGTGSPADAAVVVAVLQLLVAAHEPTGRRMLTDSRFAFLHDRDDFARLQARVLGR